MKRKLVKILMIGLLTVMVSMPCSTMVQAAETTDATEVSESVPMTEETKSSSKIVDNLEKLKAQIAGLLNIDIGQIDKIIVKTTDNVNVILKDSNVSVNIDIKLLDIHINVNQK